MGGQNEGETDEGKSSTVGGNIASDCDEVDKVERPNTILLQMKREREKGKKTNIPKDEEGMIEFE